MFVLYLIMKSVIFRPSCLQQELRRGHECVVVVVVVVGGVVGDLFVVANDRHVHYNHHNASIVVAVALDHPVQVDCFSFSGLYLLAHKLVHLASPEKRH